MKATTATSAGPSRSTELAHPELPGRELQELWFTLCQRDWRSVVLVPAGEGESAGAYALGLGEVGRWLRENPVTFVMKDALDYASGTQIVAAATSASGPTAPGRPAPAGRVIVAIQPVTVEPLGLAIAQAADAVIVCIELGRSKLRDVERTVALVGRERLAGCFLVS
ncbi:MAG TPA: hypothetical protein VFP50_18530 [Anaeromyxobacteraceae bacterium]|nr:hypothetical protein [Anaeromyxobacteraceae bacterium]